MKKDNEKHAYQKTLEDNKFMAEELKTKYRLDSEYNVESLPEEENKEK